jgi:hypothetical protein
MASIANDAVGLRKVFVLAGACPRPAVWLAVPDSEPGLRSPSGRAEVPTVTRLVRAAWVSRSVKLTAAHECEGGQMAAEGGSGEDARTKPAASSR